MQGLQDNKLFQIGFMPDSESLNRKILHAYLNVDEQGFLKRSHFFGGRYENLYLDRKFIPEVDQVLQQAERYAAAYLGKTIESIRCGFWFNDTNPGQSTSRHDHVEYDELLSGVYYIKVPAHSGNLIIYEEDNQTEVIPREGMFVFFSPEIEHAVAVNNSKERRISIGMNFGPR